MSKWTKRIIGLGIVLGLWLMVALMMALTSAPNVAQAAGQPQAAATKTPTAMPTPTLGVPFFDQWVKSPHNDFSKDNPVFHDWDTPAQGQTTASVPVTCAKCHSTPGYQDFLGADGSKAGVVDKPAPIGTTITCVACHNSATQTLTSVTFNATVKDSAGKDVPITITNLGPEARCMVCHQGRASKTQVDQQIADFKATDKPDETPAPITSGTTTRNFGFLNVHYFAAALTLYGSEVHGGYEYEGKAYDVKFDHVNGIDTCVACHDPHTTQLRLNVCSECHTGVKTVADLHKVREPSSAVDYNGNSNVTEGMYDELAGMRDALYKGIQQYAKDVSKSGIIYDTASYPYFFLDANNDNKPDLDPKDNKTPLSYNKWTPRLLKAAYNLQVASKDPGAYAHGNKYIVQLLYDSLEDLNTQLTTKVDMSKMHRNDPGHFAGNTMAFRDWDAEGEVPGSCSRCHSAAGLPEFIKEGVTTSQPTVNGFQCSTCHDETAFPKIYAVAQVPFPSGAMLSFGDGKTPVNANICLECHQGRESTVSVTKYVQGLDPDTPSDKVSFRNVHYFAAGATLFGTDAKGIFEYPNQKYNGQFKHPAFDAKGTSVANQTATCVTCHDKHELSPKVALCGNCHNKTTDPGTIRMTSNQDYNGNGDTKEGLKAEVEGYQKALYTAIQSYAKDVAKAGIVYDANAYPYFFLDKNNDGKPDVDDKGAPIRFNAWTPRLLEAAYNYQYSIKDPGAYAHNALYVMQALYDSIADLNTKLTTKVDQSKMIRPPVTATTK